MKKWRCTVCNYIHTGDEPPEKCPVCGADRSKFVEISEEEAEAVQAKKSEKQLEREKEKVREAQSGPAASNQQAQPSTETGSKPSKSGFFDHVNDLMIKYHAHPISVHLPNGVLPVTVVFMFIAALFSAQFLAWAAFYYTLVVLLSMPVVLYTGYMTWQRKYGGGMSPLFMVKIASAVVVTLTCLLVVVWYFLNPEVVMAGAARRGAFLTVNLIMFGATAVAGYVGGKIIFKD